jgi:hypothetical protein
LSASFWRHYQTLPVDIQKLADKQFGLLKANPQHPSLHLKKVSRYFSARVSNDYRALARPVPGGLLWFWIGPHDAYEHLLRR